MISFKVIIQYFKILNRNRYMAISLQQQPAWKNVTFKRHFTQAFESDILLLCDVETKG